MTPFDVPVVLFTNSPAMGGMEQHVLFLAAGFVERGIRTAVVCSARPEIAPLREELTTVVVPPPRSLTSATPPNAARPPPRAVAARPAARATVLLFIARVVSPSS